MTKHHSSPARGIAYKYAGEHGATKKYVKNVLEILGISKRRIVGKKTKKLKKHGKKDGKRK